MFHLEFMQTEVQNLLRVLVALHDKAKIHLIITRPHFQLCSAIINDGKIFYFGWVSKNNNLLSMQQNYTIPE